MGVNLFDAIFDIFVEYAIKDTDAPEDRIRSDLVAYLANFKEWSDWAKSKPITLREEEWLIRQFGPDGEQSGLVRERVGELGIAGAASFISTFFVQFGKNLANALTADEIKEKYRSGKK